MQKESDLVKETSVQVDPDVDLNNNVQLPLSTAPAGNIPEPVGEISEPVSNIPDVRSHPFCFFFFKKRWSSLKNG